MTVKDKIKIEVIKKNSTLTYLANQLGMSKQNLNHHLDKETPQVIHEIEKILQLKNGYFTHEIN